MGDRHASYAGIGCGIAVVYLSDRVDCFNVLARTARHSLSRLTVGRLVHFPELPESVEAMARFLHQPDQQSVGCLVGDRIDFGGFIPGGLRLLASLQQSLNGKRVLHDHGAPAAAHCADFALVPRC